MPGWSPARDGKPRPARQFVHDLTHGRDEPDELIRSELFSIDRLEQHGESLAAAQGIATGVVRGRPLAVRLHANERVLRRAHATIAAAIHDQRAITPAAEWLVDNFHVVEEQVREVKAALPGPYYRQLPKLADGPLAGQPRVLGLAWAFVAHSDSRLEPDALVRFVRAYQRVQPLTIGELWAVAITLRVVLIENLRRAAQGIVRRSADRAAADDFFDALAAAGSGAQDLLQDAAAAPLPLAFAAQLVLRLRDHDPLVTPAHAWLDRRLAAQGTSAGCVVADEHLRQGATNATVRNVITSMRRMTALDWTEFFEAVSPVDAALAAGSAFAAMDFASRDRYRHAVEELARGSGLPELIVVERALLAGTRDASPGGDTVASRRRRDPGHHLLGCGRRAFEKSLGYRAPLHSLMLRARLAAGITGYLATIAVLTATFVAVPLVGLLLSGVGAGISTVLAMLAVVPACDLAVAIVNRCITKQLGPVTLPALELRGGVPAELRTMIAVPTMLSGLRSIEEQVERLEVHHLANPEDDLVLALLSDWTDSDTEHREDDDELLAAARAGIARLNHRYGRAPAGVRFLLLHRRRVWNTGENRWIGWERKRGKLHELNRWLRGATDTTFLFGGDLQAAAPAGVRYVLTLDADTRLPRGAARLLVGKMAHPLNRPSLDPTTGRVCEGHAVLQPRITPSLPDADEASWYQRVYSGPCGLDPYASAVSDVYQDLLGEGSYAGKGIYDVDAFEAAQRGRVPESTVLSHDLLEGIFARAGLVTDVEIVEQTPARYDVAAARQHRWARGDWQLLPWIFGRGRDRSGQAGRAAIPVAGRWKMLDNLRRTLVAPSSLLLLVISFCLGLVPATIVTAFVLLTIAMPTALPLGGALLPRRGMGLRNHLRAVRADLVQAGVRTLLAVVLLAHQAVLMADAILTTLSRLWLRRQRMLEWLTAAQAGVAQSLDVRGFYRRMGVSVALAAAVAVLVAGVSPGSWPIALPCVVLWALSPFVAHLLSRRPTATPGTALGPHDVAALRRFARRTWTYFETFVGEEDHWLPPDNFQESPAPVVAHRTSPTNIGLYLLSVVAARDFGWITTADAAARLRATLDTLERLERCRGHFYNWYATRDLRPLEPRYVSTVDSGNLAGHLVAMGEACREWMERPALHPQWRDGIADALGLAIAARQALADDPGVPDEARAQLDSVQAAMAAVLRSDDPSAAAAAAELQALAALAATATNLARAVVAAALQPTAGADLLAWLDAVRRGIVSHQTSLAELLPWAATGSDAAPGCLGAPTLAELPDHCELELRLLATTPTAASAANDARIGHLQRSASAARALERDLGALHRRAEALVAAMQFGFLFDAQRQLLSIGYQVAENSLDRSHYDLLASEARLASFVAIAKGDVPAKHWFRLGRGVIRVPGGAALVSWSGSLFEYLMPGLVLREPVGSLLDQTSRLVVRRQIQYAEGLGIPWGISESTYNVRDIEFTYQYSSFGVPGLGLKRGLGDETVVAPYATALAAMVNPRAAVANLARIAAAGGVGRYGWYDALDYTPSRRPPGTAVAIVAAYMAHHQGMSLVAVDNALHDGIMRARFHRARSVQATELLLQERTPRDVPIAGPERERPATSPPIGPTAPPPSRRFHGAHDSVPHTNLLANGRYAVMLTAAGAGYSRWRDTAVTRWREDATRDAWGTWFYVRDVRSGAVWSAGYQPTAAEPDSYEVAFSEGRAEIVRRDGSVQTMLEVAVSPENDAEVRRVSLTNLGSQTRELDLSSYCEVVLAQPSADAAHPTFSRLFVQTEHVANPGTLTATRRRRSPEDPELWAAHLAVVEGLTVGSQQFETDRARFLGRGRTAQAPLAVMDGRPLSNTVGTVLDPIFSLRVRLRLEPGQTARVAFWTMVAPSRTEVLDLADKHRDATAFERATTMAWTQAQVQLQHLGIGAEEAMLFQRLANRVLYSDPSLRPHDDLLQRGGHGPSALWAQGISGDLPIVLVRIDDSDDLELVRQLLRAQEFWHGKQLSVDLVILNERATSYAQDLHGAIDALVRTSQPRAHPADANSKGRIFVLRHQLIAAETRTTLQTVARAVLVGRRGSLAEQVRRLPASTRVLPPPQWPAAAALRPSAPARLPTAPPGAEYWNGLGGFTRGGREYTTALGAGECTPAPWINVVANPHFGFQVSAEGAGYTWSQNSRENQITAWSNDPTSDHPGEAIYVRDLDSGTVWSPTALPIRSPTATFTAHHGQGYSRFEHSSHELALELLQFVPVDDSIKVSRLRIRNLSGRTRRLSVTAYVEWVLGARRDATAHHVVTEVDGPTRILLARNPWREEFRDRVAFVDLGGRQTGWTCDRREFLGRNGTIDRPRGLADRTRLSRRCGAGLDPCGALQTEFELPPDSSVDIVCCLGEAGSRKEALALAGRYRGADLGAALAAVTAHWDAMLEVVQVRTPDRAFDLLVNRWLLYQTIVCRLWARSAFYQAGGAYGFRDQLQDTMALALARPDLARAHLLVAAARQYGAGDVQHWWLPHSGRGVRTRISDDCLWLVQATAHYVEATGDADVLDEVVPFLAGAALQPGELEAFVPDAASDESGTLYEHCARALDHSLGVGAHGLPRIGTGDWNDGLNRVGVGGKGESVWLAWFLRGNLAAFAPRADARGERVRADSWRLHGKHLVAALENEAWDGAWYRRGYFDDGSPLGSAGSAACRIDSIAQSWAVLDGGGDPVRAARAMASLYEHLVRSDDGLVLLFTPPFDEGAVDPGYVRGYPPGIRENGGQYTHAALWAVMAFARLGDGERTAELFGYCNPIRRTRSRADVQRYRVEPYAVSADIYSVAPHAGRGGWTWYTGSSGWMHRAGLESMLGFRISGATLHIDPCVPPAWPGFEITYVRGATRYQIVVDNPHGKSRGVVRLELDGVVLAPSPPHVPLVADGATHHVRVVLG